MLPQNHVAHVDRVREGCVFGQFFQRGIGIVVIHRVISIEQLRNRVIVIGFNSQIDPITQFLHHFRSPQIVQMHDAFELAASVHDQQRRDLLLFHQSQRRRGKLMP